MEPGTEPRRVTLRRRRRAQPKFFEAVVADARTTYFHSGQHFDSSNRLRTLIGILRLAWSSDGFLAQIIYRFGSTDVRPRGTAAAADRTRRSR